MDYRLVIVTVGYIISFLTTLGLGLFVFLKGRTKKSNVLFFIMTLATSIYELTFIVGSHTANLKIAYYVWLGVLADIFIAAFYAHWMLVAIGKDELKKKAIKIIYALGIILFTVCLIFPYKFTIRVVPKSYFKSYPDGGILRVVMVVYFLGAAAYAFLQLLKSYREANSETRNRYKYYILATLIGFLTGSIAFLQVFNLGVDPIFSMFLGTFAIPLAYGIVKHQLMDIRVVIKKALLYSVIISFISGVIVAITFLSNWLTQHIPGFRVWTVPLIAAIAAFIVGNLFWRKSKEADKLKYEFITVAAHKLRTPLTRVKWMIGDLTKEINSESGKQLLFDMGRSNDQLVELTNTLLEVSKSEGDQYLYKQSPANLEELAHRVVTDLQYQFDEKKINIIFEIGNNLSLISVDQNRISSVIRIILENALIYTPSGGKVTISISREKRNLIFSVKDTGVGIDKEDLSYIFNKFFRGSRAMHIDTEGSGLGLFIARNIVERHGGEMFIESEGENKGTRVWFTVKI